MRDKVTKRKKGKGEWNRGRGQAPLAKEEGLYLDISAGVPEFLVTPLLIELVYLLSRAGVKSQSAPGGRLFA